MFIRRHVPDERGQGLVEYALILVLVAVVVITVLTILGPTVSYVYCRIVVALGGQCGGDATVVEARCTPGNIFHLRVTYDGEGTPAFMADSWAWEDMATLGGGSYYYDGGGAICLNGDSTVYIRAGSSMTSESITYQ